MIRLEKDNISTYARELIDWIALKQKDSASIIALSGDLGAGKTTFTKEIARVLGITNLVRSPTFVIEQIYDIPEGGDYPFQRLIHIDAYRLESVVELEVLGWKEAVANSENLIVIEWPENVKTGIPETSIWIQMKVVEEEEREITIVPCV